MTAENIEKFLIARGILKPEGKLTDAKDKETYLLTNESSFLNTKKHEDLDIQTAKLNEDLITNYEEKETVVFDPNTINYKD